LEPNVSCKHIKIYLKHFYNVLYILHNEKHKLHLLWYLLLYNVTIHILDDDKKESG